MEEHNAVTPSVKKPKPLGRKKRIKLIKFLRRIDRNQPLGTELYDAIALLSLSVAIEALTLRQGKNGIEIFLTKRLETDTAYPGMYHSPGTVRRPGETLETGFARLEAREFKGKLKSWTFIKNHDDSGEARGHFMGLLYLCESGENFPEGSWYPVDDLPQPMVPGHEKVLIPIAVKAFEKKLAQ